MLTEDELIRYDRQIMIFGKEGQEKLKKAKVAVVGVGGLGSPIAIYLAAVGIGKIILIDSQVPELSNLNRQVLHWEPDLGKRYKVESAKEKLEKLNSTIKIIPIKEKLNKDNIEQILNGVDIVVDALDNFSTRYILNEFCVKKGIPLIHGAVEGYLGQITTIIPGETPCLRCIFPEKQDRGEKFPIVGTTAGAIGIMQANEVIKMITGHGELIKNKLLFVDFAHNDFQAIPVKRNKNCPVCGSK